METQTESKYTAKKGSHISNQQANILGIEIERLTRELQERDPDREGDGITAEELEEAAADPNSPLHDGFGIEWDDQLAGHNWRVHQCRLLMSAIVHVVFNGQPLPKGMEPRAFIPVPVITPQDLDEQNEQESRLKQYTALENNRSNDELREQRRRDFIYDLKRVATNYATDRLAWPEFETEFKSVFEMIESLDYASEKEEVLV